MTFFFPCGLSSFWQCCWIVGPDYSLLCPVKKQLRDIVPFDSTCVAAPDREKFAITPFQSEELPVGLCCSGFVALLRMTQSYCKFQKAFCI